MLFSSQTSLLQLVGLLVALAHILAQVISAKLLQLSSSMVLATMLSHLNSTLVYVFSSGALATMVQAAPLRFLVLLMVPGLLLRPLALPRAAILMLLIFLLAQLRFALTLQRIAITAVLMMLSYIVQQFKQVNMLLAGRMLPSMAHPSMLPVSHLIQIMLFAFVLSVATISAAGLMLQLQEL